MVVSLTEIVSVVALLSLFFALLEGRVPSRGVDDDAAEVGLFRDEGLELATVFDGGVQRNSLFLGVVGVASLLLDIIVFAAATVVSLQE